MKKLMVAVAAIAMAVSAQAVQFKWQSKSTGKAIDVSEVSGYGNNTYGVGTKNMATVGSFTYLLQVYAQGTTTLLGSASGDVTYGGTGKYTFAQVDVDNTLASKEYDYVLTITGSQSDITALGTSVPAKDKGLGTYDYTKATLTAVMSGSIETKSSGATQLTDTPIEFAVSGITYNASGTPEPTSAMLMLLGVAGLALRRKQK